MRKRKACTKCGKAKALGDFPVAKGTKDGRRGECRTCRNAAARQYERARYHGSPKFRNEKNKQARHYYAEHREDVLPKARARDRAYKAAARLEAAGKANG